MRTATGTETDTATDPMQQHPSVRRILEAAALCFGRSGYRGAAMSQIAREAGVSKSLLHYHFDSKEKLLVEVQLQLLRDLLQRIRGVTVHPNTLGQFTNALDQVMDFCEREIDQLRVLLELHNVAGTNPAIAERLTRFNDQVSDLIVDGIHNVLGPVVERMAIAPDRLARLLRTIFHGLILELAYGPDAQARALVRETFADARALLAQALLREVS